MKLLAPVLSRRQRGAARRIRASNHQADGSRRGSAEDALRRQQRAGRLRAAGFAFLHRAAENGFDLGAREQRAGVRGCRRRGSALAVIGNQRNGEENDEQQLN